MLSSELGPSGNIAMPVYLMELLLIYRKLSRPLRMNFIFGKSRAPKGFFALSLEGFVAAG